MLVEREIEEGLQFWLDVRQQQNGEKQDEIKATVSSRQRMGRIENRGRNGY